MAYNEMENYYDYLMPQNYLFEMGGYHEKKLLAYCMAGFSLLICITGLFGNFLAVFVILVLKEYQRSVTYWYILQLALANSLFLLSLPFNVSENINAGFIYPEWVCKAKETILFLNYYSSVLFLVILSVDRYLAVCHSFSIKLQKLRERTASYVITSATWIASFILCFPVLLYSYKVGLHPHCSCSYQFPEYINHTEVCIKEGLSTPDLLDYCLNLTNIFANEGGSEKHCRAKLFEEDLLFPYYDTINENKNQTLFQETSNLDFTETLKDIYENYDASGDVEFMNLSHIKPLTSDLSNAVPMSCHYWNEPTGWTIFLAFNFAIMFVLPLFIMVTCYLLIIRRFSVKMMTSANPSGRRRVTIMCAALVASFVICWLPFHANHLAKIVGIKVANGKICNILPAVGSLLAYFNSALNPFLYNFLGSNFSKRWKAAIRKVLRQGSEARRFESTLQCVHISKWKANKLDEPYNSETVVTEAFRRHSNGVNCINTDYKACYRRSYPQS